MKPRLAQLHSKLHCLYCGTRLKAGTNWSGLLPGEESARIYGASKYVCDDDLLKTCVRKSSKSHFCRLCGTALISGFNFSFIALQKSYVCLPCLDEKTCEIPILSKRNKSAARELLRRARALRASDRESYSEPVLPLDYKSASIDDVMRIPSEEFLSGFEEVDIRDFLANNFEVLHAKTEKEFWIPGESGCQHRVDIVLPEHKLAVEVKKFTISKSEEVPILKQVERYQTAFDAFEPGWNVVLVCPMGKLQGSWSCIQVLRAVTSLQKESMKTPSEIIQEAKIRFFKI